MMYSVRENWFVWLAGIVLTIIIFGYGYFCFYCIQTVRNQNASIQFVPIDRVVERIITLSIGEDSGVVGQSVKRVVRVRYSLKQTTD